MNNKKELPSERLAILDCGGQYTKVIDRKVRELGVYTDIFPLGTDIAALEGYKAIILSGGPSSVWAAGAPKYDEKIFSLGVPMLGICYGMQLICEHFGGVVKPSFRTEYGQTEITVDTSCPLFDGLEEKQLVLMSHGDAVAKLPDGFKLCAKTGEAAAVVWSEEKNIVALQFHPEVDLTENGIKMLENFLRKICAFRDTYALEDRIETSVKMIRERVGNNKVVVLVSGGVDSAVTAALLVKALPPENVFAIHIDHGLMRKNESDLICENLHKLGLINMKRVNAEKEFFYGKVDADGNGTEIGPLAETTDPEMKRKIIGSMFIKVTHDAVSELGIDLDNTFLAQGTLRPDLIESGNPDVSGYAHKIKTHHNDVDMVRRARERGLIIETNWDWHKDEVRRVTRMLGLDEEIASRQPFPGPGLGVRMICSEANPPEKDPEKQAEIASFCESHNVKSYLAPILSVGVQGDCRSYKTLVTLFGDSHPDWNNIFTLAKEIPNKFSYVNRVAYCVYKDEGYDMHSDGLHVCRDAADILREADSAVTSNIMNPKIAQCFAVLIPLSCSKGKRYAIAIRAVVTSDFMTARSAIPGSDFSMEALDRTVEEIKTACGKDISMIFYDVTGKPPATVEWE